jgi:hypothetical protein
MDWKISLKKSMSLERCKIAGPRVADVGGASVRGGGRWGFGLSRIGGNGKSGVEEKVACLKGGGDGVAGVTEMRVRTP